MTTRPQVEIEVTGLRPIAERMNKADTRTKISLNEGLREIGGILLPPLRQNTPRRTGKLANSTRFQIVGGTGAQALEVRQGAKTIDGAFYGQFVREGTEPHIIRARNARALRFQIRSTTVFAKSVKHPGGKANPYHVRTLKQMGSKIQAIVTRMGDNLGGFITGRNK